MSQLSPDFNHICLRFMSATSSRVTKRRSQLLDLWREQASGIDVHLRGPALLVAVVNYIIKHPEHWDQVSWHCGSSHCMAGFGELCLLASMKDASLEDLCDVYERGTEDNGVLVYQLDSLVASWLFSGRRNFAEIYHFAIFYQQTGDGHNWEQAEDIEATYGDDERRPGEFALIETTKIAEGV